jgi:aspartate aminotransferase-like enzyme
MKEALKNLKKIVYCENGESFLVAGSGTLAMEMALLNTVSEKGRILIISQGFFGQRMEEIARSFGIDFDIITSKPGRAVPPEMLREKLSQQAYAAVVSTHADTATGTCAPIEDYAAVLADHECLFIVDGVCATGGMEENMDAWGVDVILTAAQKCFGVPPGLAVLVFSEKAMIKRRSLTSIRAFYSDILRWLPIMEDPSKYFSTPCVNEVRAFLEASRIILEEGLKVRFDRHRLTAEAIRSGFMKLGFSFFTHEDNLADTLSVVVYPAGVDDRLFRSNLFEKGVVVAGGLGQMAGKVFRMGHMGNLSFSQVYFAFEAIESTLHEMKYQFDPGSGLEAVRAFLERR